MISRRLSSTIAFTVVGIGSVLLEFWNSVFVESCSVQFQYSYRSSKHGWEICTPSLREKSIHSTVGILAAIIS
jgi:hypothetical protein